MRIVSWTASPDRRSGMLDPDSILKFRTFSNVLRSSKARCNLKHAPKTRSGLTFSEQRSRAAGPEQYDMICCKIKRSTCKACKRRRAPQQLAAHERQAGTQSMHRHALQRKSSEQRSRAAGPEQYDLICCKNKRSKCKA